MTGQTDQQLRVRLANLGFHDLRHWLAGTPLDQSYVDLARRVGVRPIELTRFLARSSQAEDWTDFYRSDALARLAVAACPEGWGIRNGERMSVDAVHSMVANLVTHWLRHLRTGPITMAEATNERTPEDRAALLSIVAQLSGIAVGWKPDNADDVLIRAIAERQRSS